MGDNIYGNLNENSKFQNNIDDNANNEYKQKVEHNANNEYEQKMGENMNIEFGKNNREKSEKPKGELYKYFTGFGDEFDKANIKYKTIIWCLVIGVLYDYFFKDYSIGISVFIYNTIFLIAGVNLLYPNVNLKRKISYVFLIPCIVLSFSYTIFNNGELAFLNLLVIPVLGVGYLISIRYSKSDLDNILISNVLDKIFKTVFLSITIFYRFCIESFKDRRKNENRKNYKNSNLKYIFKGMLISIPLLFVIIFLLSSADMVFAGYFSNIEDLFLNMTFKNFIRHLCIIMLVTVYTFGLFFRLKYEDKLKNENSMEKKSKWEAITVITIVVTINFVYCIFSVVQFSYLYAGGSGILPEGITYAQYARKGFFELILVTLINLTIVLLNKKYVKSDNVKISIWCNILYSILIVFTYNMLFSAHYRMNLYEGAFGYTKLRVFVELFILLLSLIFAVVLLGIWKCGVPILKYSFIIGITMYCIMNFVNLDKMVAKKNIERYKNTAKIDVEYLISLSYDAAPQIQRLLKVKDSNIKEEVKDYFKRHKEDANRNDVHWHQYNYYRNKAKTYKINMLNMFN
ncbi:DUF4153 domain-containing protein [Haloimpatiens massiliensis]|uniref:DUF4153 domain-containing protein n=1 Tax=Haloimpatiens massiliensis TaxID=1658110 RepID=UPI000C81849F|nr:DUF4173 domain-containing protein [Haloimpatiens massiliensis]